MSLKTNAIRLLDAAAVRYELRAYEVDESDLSVERAAAKLGMAPETVFKSIIVRGDKTGPLFALVPAETQLVPKLLAEASGNKRIDIVPLKEVLELTGYIRGAVTPLGAKKPYPVFVDETVQLWPLVGISGGHRGLEVLIAPEDLIRVTGATLADFVRPS